MMQPETIISWLGVVIVGAFALGVVGSVVIGLLGAVGVLGL